jgi:hypothetical protein
VTADVDLADTRQAWRNRDRKTAALSAWLTARGLNRTDVAALDDDTRRRVARAVGVNPPKPDGPTWPLVLDALPTVRPPAAEARPGWLPVAPATSARGRSAGQCAWCSQPVRWVSGPPSTETGHLTVIALDPEPAPAGALLVDEASLTSRSATDADDSAERWQDHALVCPRRPRVRAETAEVVERCDTCGAVLDPAVQVGGVPDPDLHPTCTRIARRGARRT